MISLQKKDIEIQKIINKAKDKNAGAIITFLGTVRENTNGKKVKSLEFEVYKEMALKKLKELREITLKKFDIIDVSIVHRYGKLKVKENIVLIVVSSKHRKEGFLACEFVIDELKKIVPIWKEEVV